MERRVLNCQLIKQTQMATLIRKCDANLILHKGLLSNSPPSSHIYNNFTGSKFDIDIFKSEAKRFETFKDWPVYYIDKCVLAATGMFYTGTADKVKCYFCDVELGHWREGDHPVQEHILYSSECPLLKRRITNNIPKDPTALERILPPPYGSDAPNGGSQIEIRYGAYPEGKISSSRENKCLMEKISYPEYASEESRLYSFADWPYIYHTQPEKLAEAGLFYTGVEDRVNCFACGGGLKDWDIDDDPWVEHAIKLDGKCCFLLTIKGQKFIDRVRGDLNKRETTIKSELDNIANGNNTKSNSPTLQCDQLCKICYGDQYNTALLPCGHVVACSKCAKLLNECPMCRCKIEKIINIYF